MRRSYSEVVESSPVTVNVYDMSSVNEYIGGLGLGVFHTGVEVYDREYCYGGHQFGGSGIFEMNPKDSSYLGPNYGFKTSIIVGSTDFTSRDVSMILTGMEQDFCGDQYHLLRKNCNHFASAFIEILCGGVLPKWINRLALVSTKLPFIERSIPKEWLTPLQSEDDASTGSTSKYSDPPVNSSNKHPLTPTALPKANGSIRNNSNSSPSSRRRLNPDSPDAASSAIVGGAGEQWRKFQLQVSNYFTRGSVLTSTTNNSNSSSSANPTPRRHHGDSEPQEHQRPARVGTQRRSCPESSPSPPPSSNHH